MHDSDRTPHSHDHHTGMEVHAHLPDSALRRELVTHLPLSVAMAAIGLVLAGLICFLAPNVQLPGSLHEHADAPAAGVTAHDDEHVGHDHAAHDAAGEAEHDHDQAQAADEHGHSHTTGYLPLFHLFHPLHMLFSAAATTAMFWRYDKRLIRAVIVGLIGAVGVCGLSDILIPHLGLLILGQDIPLHICVLEHPWLVLPFAAIGIFLGLMAAIGVSQSTLFSHSLHVFVSTMASIFYMVNAYEWLGWVSEVGVIFVFIIIAVVGPCCLSDIIFPVAMSKNARDRHAASACCH